MGCYIREAKSRPSCLKGYAMDARNEKRWGFIWPTGDWKIDARQSVDQPVGI